LAANMRAFDCQQNFAFQLGSIHKGI